MPRPNAHRDIYAEGHLARRIAIEREKRGYSYEGLAERLTRVGCAINGSALYKIEKATPPRRITVDELVALARVFETPIEELLLPPEVAASQELGHLFIAWHEARDAAAAARETADESESRLKRFVADHPEVGGKLRGVVEVWAEYLDFENPEDATTFTMYRLTDSDEWKQKVIAAIERQPADGLGSKAT